MAKETTSAATPGRDRILPKGEGARILKAFQELIHGKDLPVFPEAACIAISDLRAYLDAAEKVILESGGPMPENQRGIAIVPGYREGKITFALVATRFTEDQQIQKVFYINNPVTGIHGIPPSDGGPQQTLMAKSSAADDDGEGDADDPPVDDYTFDTISTRP